MEKSQAEGIDNRALIPLMDYDWPGNVREMQNAIERAAIVAEGIITLSDIPGNIRQPNSPKASGSSEFQLPHEGINLDDFEKMLIVQAVEMAEGNKTKAAELLGITRRRLYSMMERFRNRYLMLLRHFVFCI